MPANLAVAVNERLDYSVVKAPDGNRCVNRGFRVYCLGFRKQVCEPWV
jgi:isoleucyl-tRNA synthetase